MKSPSLTTIAATATLAVAAALVSVPGAAAHTATAHTTAAAAPQVRVNQVGYAQTSAKTAYVMLPRQIASVRFVVESPHGSVYLTGRSTDDVGSWNTNYQAVYELDFSAFEHPGTYRIKIVSPVSAS